MKQEKTRLCPICKTYYSGYPALSRTDNKTEICSICGQNQAFQDFFSHQKNNVKKVLDRDDITLALVRKAKYSKKFTY